MAKETSSEPIMKVCTGCGLEQPDKNEECGACGLTAFSSEVVGSDPDPSAPDQLGPNGNPLSTDPEAPDQPESNETPVQVCCDHPGKDTCDDACHPGKDCDEWCCPPDRETGSPPPAEPGEGVEIPGADTQEPAPQNPSPPDLSDPDCDTCEFVSKAQDIPRSMKHHYETYHPDGE